MGVSLRKIREEDLEQIIEWRMRPDITKYMNTNPKLTLDAQKKWLTSIEHNPDVEYWLILVDQEPAGVIDLVGLTNEDERVEWAYYMGENRLRSMSTAISLEMSLYDYAFDVLHKKAVFNEIFSLNKGVIAIHKLAGCSVIEERPKAICKEDVLYDLTIMEITADQWKEYRQDKQYEKIIFGEE